MNRNAIRVANLARLVEQYKTIAEVAKRGETDPNYLSQILNGHLTRTGKPRTVGNDLADRLEEKCGKHQGWMDIDHDNPPQCLGDMTKEEQQLIALWRQSDDRLRESIFALARLAD
jgi:hypothetical protein